MPKKNSRKQPAKTALSIVRTVMAKPRVAESSKKNADTLANGGHMAVPAAKRATGRLHAAAWAGTLFQIPDR
jgi:hypothetical protein